MLINNVLSEENENHSIGGFGLLDQKNPDYGQELSEIEKKINQYEKASYYLNDVKEELYNLPTYGFEKEKYEIKTQLYDLDSFEKVKQLFYRLKENIQQYKIEREHLQKEFNLLPSELMDDDKKRDIQILLSSPKTIHQAKDWIRNIKRHIKDRNRICFPRELTQYTNEYLIGTGGFSRVYRVKNIKENRIAAVKIPIKNDACIGKSFLRELNNWVSLNHPNIVKIYQYNILPVPYIEMEWCDSCLEDIEKPVQFNLALHYIHGVAKGLQYAHRNNIAHFDLKPQNILLKNDIPKITDWGLSRLLTLQGTTTIGISLPFAAPEQFSTKYGKRDGRTDIWQVGILLYHLLTNSIPFSGNDFAEYGKNITTKNIKKMISEDDSIEDVSHILINCLERKKRDRYKNIDFLLKDIEEIM